MIEIEKRQEDWWVSVTFGTLTTSKSFDTKYQAEAWSNGVLCGFECAKSILDNIYVG